MVDQRGRDNPPIFYLDTQIANYRYHVLLTEPVSDAFDMLLDLNRQDQELKEVNGEFHVTRPRGIYGFQRIEDRDKFCKRCNALSEIDEYAVCYPVFIPNLVLDLPSNLRIKYQKGQADLAKEGLSDLD